MTIPDAVLRAALEEYIRFGPESVRPADERLARRLPLLALPTRAAALSAAGGAVAVAEQLAREFVDGGRSQSSVEEELARRFPWLRAAAPGAPRRPWWRRLLPGGGDLADDLVSRLGHFGYYLVIK